MAQRIKFQKQENGNYITTPRSHVIYQVQKSQDYGVSLWAIAIDENSEPYFYGHLNECKNHFKSLYK